MPEESAQQVNSTSITHEEVHAKINSTLLQ